MPRVLATLLLAGALAGATALPAAAVDFNPVVPVSSDGLFPNISVDPATGNGLVVWVGDDDIVYGQIVDEDLAVVLPAVAISTAASQIDGNSPPFAAWNNEDSNWLVSWDNDSVVRGRVFDASGPIGSVGILADHWIDDALSVFSDIEQVEAAWNPTANAYLVGFKGTVAGCQLIFGVLVDEDGLSYSATGATILSSDDPPAECDAEVDNGVGLDFAPTTNDWFVTWYSQDGNEEGRFINVSFLVPGNASAVLTLGTNTGRASGSVRYDPINDQFLVAWLTGSAPESELRGVWVLVDHTVGSTFPITDGTRDLRRPRLDYDAATGNFLVVAHAQGLDNDLADVYLWELPAGSMTTVTNPQLVSEVGLISQRPTVGSYLGCVMVLWQNTPEDEGITSVLGRSSCATLPATGADATGPVLLVGSSALLLGFAALVFARSRRSTALG